MWPAMMYTGRQLEGLVMSVERNKGFARRLFEVWNTGNVDAVEELYAADFIADYRPYAPLRHGHDAIRGMVRRAHVAFPDYHEELEEMVAEGDKVVVRFTITGTQLGQWGPVSPTGKRVRSKRSLFCASSTERSPSSVVFLITSRRYVSLERVFDSTRPEPSTHGP